MTSIPQLSRTIRKLLFVEANQLAAQAGVIQRQRMFSGASLLQLLVFGWLKHPQAGPSQLARFAGSLGLKLSKQAVEERFTRRTADWLLAVLQRGVQLLICAQAVSIPRLPRFTAVLVEDGSTISLPAALAQVWRECLRSGAQTDGAPGFAARQLEWPLRARGAAPRNAESLARAADAAREPVDRRSGVLCPDVAHAGNQAGRVLPDGLQRASGDVECPRGTRGGGRPVTHRWVRDGGYPGDLGSAQAGAGAPDR
jgi:hypothetical protein